MSQRDTSNRYSPGGDLYADIERDFGRDVANRAYNASLRDDGGASLRQVLSDARQLRRGGEVIGGGSESTLGIFWDQITTDPLNAPLAALDSQLGKAFFNMLKNPFVLLLVVGLLYWQLKKRRIL